MAVLLYLTCWSASPTSEKHRKLRCVSGQPLGWLHIRRHDKFGEKHPLKKKTKHLTKIQGSHSNTNTRNLPTKNFQNHLPNKGSAPSNPNTRNHKNLNLQKTCPSNLNIRNVAPSPRSAPHIDQDDRVAELTVPGWLQRWSILPGVGLNSLLGNLYWIASAFRFVDLFFAHLVWLRLTGNRQKEQVTRKRG